MCKLSLKPGSDSASSPTHTKKSHASQCGPGPRISVRYGSTHRNAGLRPHLPVRSGTNPASSVFDHTAGAVRGHASHCGPRRIAVRSETTHPNVVRDHASQCSRSVTTHHNPVRRRIPVRSVTIDMPVRCVTTPRQCGRDHAS